MSSQVPPSQALPDLSGLAQLAADPTLDLRPVLLRVQTDLFAAAPARDRATVEAYEALALGLLPIVEDEVVATVARRLAPVAEAPATVLTALLRRGGEARAAVIALAPALPSSLDPARLVDRGGADALALAARADLPAVAVASLLDRNDPALDRALASRAPPLPDEALARLTDRARERADLATLLLARSDLSLADEAALYLHADPARRETIAERLAGSALRVSASPRTDAALADDLVAALKAKDVPGFDARLAETLGLAAVYRWNLDAPETADLLALALQAAGLAEDQIIRLFLLQDDDVARSVAAIFRVAALVRATPRLVALRLVEAIFGQRLALTPSGARHVPLLAPEAAAARTGERRETPDQKRLAG